MSTAGSLLRGSVFRTLDLVVLVAASFFVTPYLVHSLGDRVYGFWTLVVTLIGYYGLLDLGLSSAAARYLSQALGKGDSEEVDRVAGTAFVLFSAIGVAVVLLSLLSAWACPRFVRDPAEIELFRKLLVIMGAAAAISFPARMYMGMLMAGIRYDTLAFISIGRSILCNGAIYVCLVVGRGVLAVAGVTLVVAVLQYAATYFAFRASFPDVRPRWAIDRERLRAMLDYGSKTLVCQMGDVLRFRLDTVLIAAFLGASLVTPYAVGSRLVEGYAQVLVGSVAMMLPVFSQYEGRGEFGSIRYALLEVTKMSTMLSTFVGMSLLFYGPAFIRRWMGPGFGSAYWVAAILTVGYMIELPQFAGIQLLYGLSKHRFYAVLSAVEGVFNLAMSLWLLHVMGIYGVALGTTLDFAVFKLFVQPIYVCRVVALPVRQYLLHTILGTSAKVALPLALFFLAVRRFVQPSYGSLACWIGLQTLLLAPAGYYLLMDRSERETIENAVGALLPRRRRAAAASVNG